jgi:hypothetical protein
MLEQYFTKPWALRRHRSRLLGPHIDSFVDQSAKLGYPQPSVRHQCRVLGRFSDWLERRRVCIGDIDASLVELHVRGRTRAGREGESATLRRFLDHLRTRGVIRPRESRPRPSAVLIACSRSGTRAPTRSLATATASVSCSASRGSGFTSRRANSRSKTSTPRSSGPSSATSRRSAATVHGHATLGSRRSIHSSGSWP